MGKRFRELTQAATDADFVEGNYFGVDTPSVTKKVPANLVAKASEQAAIATYAQNVAHSIAPEFDPTKPDDAGGYAYYKDEIVSNNGATYRFKVNHPSGAWNAAEVDRYVAGESLKFLVVTDNPEYLYAVTDKNDIFLFGIKKDGSVDWQKGFPEVLKKEISSKLVALKNEVEGELATKVDKVAGKALIDSVFADSILVTTDSEYLYAVTDKEGVFLFGIKKDGSIDWQEGVPLPVRKEISRQMQAVASSLNTEIISLQNGKVDKILGKSLIDSIFASANFSQDYPDFLKVLVDYNEAVLEAIGKDGTHKFFNDISFGGSVGWGAKALGELVEALKATGFTGGAGDWSDAASLQIPIPRFAIVNISGVEGMPQTKTSDLTAYMQFWDNNGNYFKKKLVSFNAQGNSSLAYPKKNASFDIVNADDSSFKLKFGDWVSQDSFHLKAYFTDFFRGTGAVGYSIYKSIVDTRGVLSNRTWKLANVDQSSENWGYGLGVGGGDLQSRIDDGALCFPMGFPCALYLNGSFYGLFSWQLKKHRDNYNMSKSNAKHIHLDGTLGYNFFDGQIDWTAFEVRNPKDLYCMDGSKYDGDNPKELIDPTSASYDAGNSKHVKTYQVKQSIILLSQSYSVYNSQATTEEKKTSFETYFDVDNLIDYQIFCDITHNVDGLNKNWQWTTWDGEKWYVNAYDLDGCFGANPNGDAVYIPRTTRLGNTSWTTPVNFEQMQYSDRLNARYAELRSSGVITAEKLTSILVDWVLRVGKDFYDLEYSAGHWDDVPCNRDMVVNSDYWELKVDENGEPIIAYDTTNSYNSATSYQQGDECTYNKAYSGTGWYYTLVCLQDCQNKEPITKSGFKDSVWRVKRWLEKNLENMDVVYNYNNN